ncbi:MAG: hypothetical protein ABI852_21940, partial [Gemmatimonadaceae bacterium]
VRSRVDKLVNNKEVDVIDGNDIGDRMYYAGFGPDTTYTIADIRAIATYFRVDEYLLAHVSNSASGTRITGELVLLRDERLRQPIVAAQAAKLDSAASLFAKNLVAARAQLTPQRRCENALRDGDAQKALTAAREGVAVYSRSTIARSCLMWAMRTSHASARDVLAVAREILTYDSTSFHAIESAAIALDSLKQRDDAATMYLRLAATDTANMELATRVIYSLMDGQNSKRAEPFIVHLAETHPEELKFTQQKWRAAYENKNWTRAVAAGEELLTRDSLARSDSTFHLRLGTAYRNLNKPYDAIRTLANAVKAFPKDARIYSLYTQSIKAESDTVIPRGLALFPTSAELLAMNGKDLRSRGKIAESLDATKKAVELDSTMAQGRLVVAQLEMELGRPDSALMTLRRAVAGGEDTTLVAQFTLGKGNQFYRAAGVSKLRGDFELAYRFLTFADTLKTSVQSKFLIGATALGIAQTVLTESSKHKEKAESCPLVRIGSEMITVAQSGLTAGLETFGEAATQSLYFLSQLEPYAAAQMKSQCDVGIK